VSFVVTALFKPINHKGHEGPQRKTLHTGFH
jgi:hypothetical protein